MARKSRTAASRRNTEPFEKSNRKCGDAEVGRLRRGKLDRKRYSVETLANRGHLPDHFSVGGKLFMGISYIQFVNTDNEGILSCRAKDHFNVIGRSRTSQYEAAIHPNHRTAARAPHM